MAHEREKNGPRNENKIKIKPDQKTSSSSWGGGSVVALRRSVRPGSSNLIWPPWCMRTMRATIRSSSMESLGLWVLSPTAAESALCRPAAAASQGPGLRGQWVMRGSLKPPSVVLQSHLWRRQVRGGLGSSQWSCSRLEASPLPCWPKRQSPRHRQCPCHPGGPWGAAWGHVVLLRRSRSRRRRR
jgi:hypothetical protein